MIQNDLPTEVLTEEKYQAQKKKLKTIALCLIGAGVAISLTIGIIGFLNSDAHTAGRKRSDFEQLLQEEEAAFLANYETVKSDAETLATKIDQEKRAIVADYDLLSYSQISSDERLELKRVDQKHQSEIKAMQKEVSNLGFGVDFRCGETSMCEIHDPFNRAEKFEIDKNGSEKLRQLETDAKHSEFFSSSSLPAVIIPALIPLVMLGSIGFMLLLMAHQRNIAAFGAQGTLPVASEGIGKLTKSLDDNGTLDIIAETGAKMMAKSADAQKKHKVPEKSAELKKAHVRAMNKSGATTASAKQAGVYAEEVAKGIKKGLNK